MNSDTLYDAIHILSHGSAGHLYLGSADLNSNNLTDYQSQLQKIGSVLTDIGDLLLYGCNVAEGDEGNQFITALAEVTGADVAASDDLTGAAALGGDWVLEANRGVIETSVLSLSNYANSLASANEQLADSGLYLRDFILQNGNFDLSSFNSEISTEYSYLDNLQIDRNAILKFLDDLPLLPDFKPYDVTEALYSAIKIGHINSNFQAIQDQVSVIRNALSEISDTSVSWFDSYITDIFNTYNSDVADLPGFGADELWEATGFVSSAVGNVTDLIFDQLEEIKDLGDAALGTFSLIHDVTFNRDELGEKASHLFEMFFGVLDYIREDFHIGSFSDDVAALAEYVTSSFSSLWGDSVEDFSELRDEKGQLFDVFTGEYSIWTLREKTTELFKAFKEYRDVRGYTSEEFLDLFLGVKVDFWINQPTFDAGDVLDVLFAILEMAAIGGEKSELERYLDGPSEGLEFGGREIAEISLEIKNNEWLSIITDTLVPKSLDLIASFELIEPRVEAGLTALSEAVDTWLQSRNVSNITDLSVLIDQLTIVDEAVTKAYSQFTIAFENALSRLPSDWGSDIPLERILKNSSAFIGTNFVERISGTEQADTINAGVGNDIVYGQAGNDWIAGDEGDDTIYAGSGDDEVYGGTGNDYIKGQEDNDTIYGEENDDEIYGDGGNDTLGGGTGNDTIYGGEGIDTIRGEEDNDILFGQGAWDTIYGDGGNDILAGGEAPDKLIGGPGSDTFVYDTSELTTYQSFWYLDEIKDFNQGNTPGTFDPTEGDRLDLSAIVGTAYDGGNGEPYSNLVRLVERPAGTTSRTVLEVNPDGIGDDWIQIAYLDGIRTGNTLKIRLDATGAPIDIVVEGNGIPNQQDDDYADEASDSSAAIGILSVGGTIRGVIGPADSDDTYGDKDVFKVSLTQGQSYQIQMQSTEINGQTLPQSIFTVRDPNNFDTVLSTSAIGANVTVNFTANSTGDYYIRVGTGGAATDQGGYQLSVTAITNSVPQATGINQTINTATAIPLADLFDWSDPDGLEDIVSFAVRDREIGGGYLTQNGTRLTDGQLYDNIPISDIGNWAFVAGDAGSVDHVAFNAIDAAGAFNTPSAVATVSIAPTPNNVITGNSSSQTINGTTGNDSIDGGGGNDVIDGGAGTDTVIFFDNRANYSITTLEGVTRVYGLPSAASRYNYAEVFLTNVENVQFADATVAIAPTSNNLIIKTANSETINGTPGNDTIDGRGGNDLIDGGAGTDTVIFFDNRANYSITTLEGVTRVAALATAASRYSNDELFLTNVENIQFAGTTVAIAPTSNNLIIKTTASETINGTIGNDTIDGRGGNDVINGDAGNDTVIFFDNRANYSITTLEGVTRVAALATAASRYSYDEVFLTNVENVQFADTTIAIAPTSNNLIIKTTASETINGTSGNDTIDGRGGNDVINGDAGNDTVIFFDNRANYSITTLEGVTRVAALATAASRYSYDEVFLTNVENVQFADATAAIAPTSNNLIIKTTSSETINGTSGNDTIDGRGGNDVINGDAGNDTVIFFDNRANYSITTLEGVTRVAALATAASRYSYDEVFLTNVENVQFADATAAIAPTSNNLIIKTTSSETINGTSGNDTIDGRGGNDVINGDAGNDTVIFFDNRANYSITTLEGVTRVAALAKAASRYSNDELFLTNVENIQFAGTTVAIAPTSNNLIIKTTASETINGTAGNDTIDGRGGNDVIDGGAGNDTVIFFDNRANYSITTLAGVTRVAALATAASRYSNDELFLTNVENIQFAGTTVAIAPTSNNLIIKTTASETINGTAGNDTIDGRGGNDVIDGGAGNDTVIFFDNRANYSITTLEGVTRVAALATAASRYSNDEVFLTNVENIQFEDATVSIAPTTLLPELAIAALEAVKPEGDSGITAFTFTVTRTGDLTAASSAAYALTGSGANPADAVDFGGSLPNGTVNFAAGEASQTVTVNVTGDTAVELDEGFTVALSAPSNATLGTATASGTIQNDDVLPPPVLAIAALDAVKPEGDSGITAFTFTVTRTGDLTAASSAAYALTGSGTNAADANDFGGSLPAGTVNFAIGQASQTVTVNVSGDTVIESDEGFTVTLSTPANATISTATATGTILNDDVLPPPVLAIAALEAVKAEGDSGMTALYLHGYPHRRSHRRLERGLCAQRQRRPRRRCQRLWRRLAQWHGQLCRRREQPDCYG